MAYCLYRLVHIIKKFSRKSGYKLLQFSLLTKQSVICNCKKLHFSDMIKNGLILIYLFKSISED